MKVSLLLHFPVIEILGVLADVDLNPIRLFMCVHDVCSWFSFFALHYFHPTARCERDNMPPEMFQADSHQQIELIGIHSPSPRKGLM